MGDPPSERDDEQKGGQGDRSPGLTDNDLYRALSSENRRRLLWYLLAEHKATLEEVSAELVGWETTEEGDMVTPADRQRMLNLLVHQHVPILVEARLVSHDRDSGVVRIEPLDEEVRDLIRQGVTGEPESET